MCKNVRAYVRLVYLWVATNVVAGASHQFAAPVIARMRPASHDSICRSVPALAGAANAWSRVRLPSSVALALVSMRAKSVLCIGSDVSQFVFGVCQPDGAVLMA